MTALLISSLSTEKTFALPLETGLNGLATDANGGLLADQTVALDRTDSRYAALLNLPAYLKHYAAPDKGDAEERQLHHGLGAWIGQKVLGPGI